MTTTINASPTNGIVQTGDGSGVMKLQSNGVTTNALAWVNFNGTGTVAIRSSYNVSSITDNGTGDYTVNFATALSDANYAVAGIASISSSGMYTTSVLPNLTAPYSASAFRMYTRESQTTLADCQYVNVVIFGN